MLPILKLFIDLCLFRAAPQDLPYSTFLMAVCLCCYSLVAFVSASFQQTPGLALITASVDTVLMIGLAYLGLWIRDRTPRAVQTITALCGAGALIGILGWILLAWLQGFEDESSNAIGNLITTAFYVWVIGIIGNIIRHALDIPVWLGIGISLLYVYNSIRIMIALQIAGGSI